MVNYSLVRKLFSQVAMFSLVGVLIVVFLPCNSYSGPSGKVIIGSPVDITNRGDPLRAGGIYKVGTLSMHQGLFGFNWKGEVENHLCTSHEISNDGLTYTFHLRKGAKFHNGDPVTAEDVAFLIEHIRDPAAKCPYGSYLAKIREAEVVDTYTVKFHLSAPDVFLINKLACPYWAGIVPKKLTKKRGYAWLNRNPVGTGPYKFVSMVTGERLIMEANESYWGEVPAIKTLEIRVIPEPAARMAALRTGEVDIVQSVPVPEMKVIAADPRLKVVGLAGGEAFYIAFMLIDNVNHKVNPFMKDVRVRKAFNYAINQEEIVEKLLPGSAKVSGSIVPPSQAWYDPKNTPLMYDPQKAKQLLKEANFDSKQTFTLFIPTTRYNMGKEVALAIVDQLAAVGIKLNLNMSAYSQWIGYLMKDKFPGDMTYMSMPHVSRTPDTEILNSVYSKGSKFSYINNPELDKMIDELITVADPAKQIEKAKLIHKKIYDEALFIPLWENVQCWGAKKKIDFRVGPRQFPFFETLTINP